MGNSENRNDTGANRPDQKNPPTEASAFPNRKRRFPLKTVLVLFALVIIAAILWRRHQQNGVSKLSTSSRGASGPIAVLLGTVAEKNVPVYLDGLGTVQAFSTVTVRSRVDGQLQKLAFTEGKDVKAGDLIAQIDPDPFRTQLEQAQAKQAQDKAQLVNAQIELKRDAALLASKIVAQEVYDAQKAQTQQLEAAVQADQAAIDSAQVQLNYTTIRAPMDGRVGIRQTDQGNIIHANDTNGIVTLTQLKPISIVFTLPEQNLGEIQQQFSSGEMKVVALDRDNRTVLDKGKLAVIDNQIDTGTGTIRMKGTFPNPNLKLWPGQFVNTRLLLRVLTNALVVPASVVQRGPNGAYAFTVSNDMSVKMQPVNVAFIERQDAVIESGLKSGERVVVDGQYKLQQGSKVKPAGEGRESKRDAKASSGSGASVRDSRPKK